jgi:hypothetical protein
MSITKVTFEFPTEAWDGIVLSLTDNQWPETIPNPEYDGSDVSVPSTIPNNGDRGQAAITRIKNFVEQEFKTWATRERLALVYSEIQSGVRAIAESVTANTTASVETIAAEEQIE